MKLTSWNFSTVIFCMSRQWFALKYKLFNDSYFFCVLVWGAATVHSSVWVASPKDGVQTVVGWDRWQQLLESNARTTWWRLQNGELSVQNRSSNRPGKLPGLCCGVWDCSMRIRILSCLGTWFLIFFIFFILLSGIADLCCFRNNLLFRHQLRNYVSAVSDYFLYAYQKCWCNLGRTWQLWK